MDKKKIGYFCLAVCLIGVLFCSMVFSCACTGGRYLVTMCISNETPTSVSMEYESFDGYKIFKMKLDKVTNIDLQFTTVSGKLDCTITNQDGEVYYSQENLKTGGFGMSFAKGVYTVRLDGDHHQGGFSFNWGN